MKLLVLNSISKPKFFLGFYFWLDMVSTLSLLGDIPEFMELVTGEEQDGNDGVNESTTLARAGRTSRAGTRAGRIARVRLHCFSLLQATLKFFAPR